MVVTLAVATLIGFQAEATDAGNNGLLEVIRDGHINSRQAIQSLQVEYQIHSTETEGDLVGTDLVAARWWQEGNRLRLTEHPSEVQQQRNGYNLTDMVIVDGLERSVLSIVEKDGSSEQQGLIRHSPVGEARGWTDAWSRGLFVLRDIPLRWVSDALTDPDSVERVAEDSGSGELLYQVDLRPLDNSTYRLWFSPSKNFLVQKIAKSHPETSVFAGIESEVLEFVEAKPGVWFPQEVEMRVYRKSESNPAERYLWRLHRTSFTAVAVNEPIEDEVFELSFPEGAQITDELDGTTYFWQDGQPSKSRIPLAELYKPGDVKVDETSRVSGRTLLIVNLSVAGLLILGITMSRRRGSAS